MPQHLVAPYRTLSHPDLISRLPLPHQRDKCLLFCQPTPQTPHPRPVHTAQSTYILLKTIAIVYHASMADSTIDQFKAERKTGPREDVLATGPSAEYMRGKNNVSLPPAPSRYKRVSLRVNMPILLQRASRPSPACSSAASATSSTWPSPRKRHKRAKMTPRPSSTR